METLSIGAILTAFTVALGAILQVITRLQNKDGRLDGLTCGLLAVGAIPFWLAIVYSVYFLTGLCLKAFDQPLNPTWLTIIWPTALLPFAPIVFATFMWWHSYLVLLAFVRPKDLSTEDLEAHYAWHRRRIFKSIIIWGIGYLLILILIQLFNRVPCLANLPWPAPL